MAEQPKLSLPEELPRELPVPQVPEGAISRVGAAISEITPTITTIAHRERILNASFDAVDRELNYGEKADKVVEEAKQSIKAVKADDVNSYQKQVAEIQQKAEQDILNSRTEIGGTLKDPFAFRQFNTRTRLQTQAAARHLMLYGDSQIQNYRKATLDAVVRRDSEAMGNVFPTMGETLSNIEQHVHSIADSVVSLSDKPGPAKEELVHEATVRGVRNTLEGYGKAGKFNEGLSFLQQKFSDGTRVAFDPEHPDEKYILSSAEVQTWKDHLRRSANEQNGKGLGSTWYFSGAKDPEMMAREFIEKGGDPLAAAQATLEYETLATRHESQIQRSEARAFRTGADVIANNFGGDYDAAFQAGALNGVHADLRERLKTMFYRAERKDKIFEIGMNKFMGDVVSLGHGWSENWKSMDDFAHDWQERLGPGYWPHARAAFEQDHNPNRDRSQDKGLSHQYALMESTTRAILGWERNGAPDRNTWDLADPWRQELHAWATEQWDLGVKRHLEDERKGKHNENWASDLRTRIKLELMKGKNDRSMQNIKSVIQQSSHPAISEETRKWLLPHVDTEAAVKALPKGSQFVGPDNEVHTVP